MQTSKSEQGQTLVEFALILPILLLLVLGIFDFGSALNSKNDLNFLANTAARYAEVNACAGCSNGQTIANYVASTADFTLTCSAGTKGSCITFCLPPLPNDPSGTNTNDGSVGNPLRVSATTNVSWFGGINLPGLPTSATHSPLTSTVTVRILQKSDGSLYTASACS